MSDADANQNMDNKCPQCGAPLPSGVLAGLCPACLFKQGAAADTSIEPEPAAFEPPSLAEVARMFPQLEIIAFLGKGGMGVVYKARQPALDRLVALKIIPPQTAAGSGFVERFNREARALAKLTHPNIVAVHEFGQVNGQPFFIMEFVDGLNLRELERVGQLSPPQALKIVPQICDALQFAHDEGIVHRDIKPENILLDKKGRVKIADFGIAKIIGTAAGVPITETKGAIGTPHYMAPEQVERPASVDHRADIFSLGVVFYEMLTGELPLGKFAPPSTRKVEVDVRLDDIVLHALEKDPERRYQHVSQVKTAVDTIVGSAPPPAPSSEGLAREILARDYSLDIGSCVRRAWALVKKDFWPLIGCTALILVLMGFASSAGPIAGNRGDMSVSGTSVLALLVFGPLMGGLYLYYLKKIRGESVNIETAFSGFNNRFLHLFLAGFVTWVLTLLGFFCFILPGIYLLVAWWLALPLVLDKQLDFWSAMELSRKVISRHWWKFFGLTLVMLLLCALGLAVFIIGFFITAPVAMIAAMYAYEDIFSAVTVNAATAAAGAGPSGTVRMPVSPGPAAATGGAWHRLAPRMGLVALVLAAVATLIFLGVETRRASEERERDRAIERADNNPNADFDTLMQRVREELNNMEIRFNALHLAPHGDNNLTVSFSGLEKKQLNDGTNGWQSVEGSLAADRVDGGNWRFQGLGELQSLSFDLRNLDMAKLLESAAAAASLDEGPPPSREALGIRLEAATAIGNTSAKDAALFKVAVDAAKAGEMEIVHNSLNRIGDQNQRWHAAHVAATTLAKRGLKKEAIEVAKAIGDMDLRDQVLSQLAH